jgi:hypothetical protein
MQLLQVIVTEALTKPISFMVANMKSFIVDKMILKKEDYKTEFDQSDEITWLLYYMLVFLFTTILFPYVTLL